MKKKKGAPLTLGNLPQSPPFFPEINYQPHPSPLRTLDGLLDPVNQVGAASTDVRPEHVGSVAFVVDPQGELFGRITEMRGVAEDVDGQAADGGEEGFEVGSGDQFGVHPAGLYQEFEKKGWGREDQGQYIGNFFFFSFGIGVM